MEEKTVEQSFKDLESIIQELEKEDVSLDDSFRLYKSGIEELRQLSTKIDETKKAVLALSTDGSLETFEEDENE
ncbi:MAG: exodeoxyribonuclease VII small subunit [Pseudobutyrivibrio sp.]|nr:exodeoxyribonuclease VII small subunit [Pseudobutyrivibrio sp.]